MPRQGIPEGRPPEDLPEFDGPKSRDEQIRNLGREIGGKKDGYRTTPAPEMEPERFRASGQGR
jgi:hypothetical protein